MAVITSSSLVAAQESYQTLFWEGHENFEMEMIDKCLRTVPSSQDIEDYQGMGAIPRMREWIGDRVVQQLRGMSYRLENITWELTIGVPRERFDDDRLGNFAMRFSQMGNSAATHPAQLLSEIRVNGETEKCYDDKAFFSSNHEEGRSGVQSNLVTGTGASKAQIYADIGTAVNRIVGFKNDQGQPLRPFVMLQPKMFLITCPPELFSTFSGIMEQEMLFNGESNQWRNYYDLVSDARLADANDWYIELVNMMDKPYLKQERRELSFFSLQNPMNDEVVRYKNEYQFCADARYNIGYYLWQGAVKVKNN